MHPSIYFIIAGVIVLVFVLTRKTGKNEEVTTEVVLPVTRSTNSTSVTNTASSDSGTGFAAVLTGNPVAAVTGGVIGGYTGGMIASAVFDDSPSYESSGWDWDD